MKRKKLIIPFLLVVIIIIGIFLYYWISAKSFTIGDYDCRFENGTGKLECSIVLQKYNGSDANVVIPSHILLWKVKYIAEDFFTENGLDNTTVETVVVPDSVEYISEKAFENCIVLRQIQLGKNIKAIGRKAFLRCLSLEQIEFPDSLTKIDGAAFGICTALKEITIPDSVQYIGDNAFAECTRLEKVTGGNGLTEIGNTVFEGTQWLLDYPTESVILGKMLVAYKGNEKDVYLEEGIVGVSPKAFYDIEVDSIHMPDTLSYFNLRFSEEYINKHGKVKVYFPNSNDIVFSQRMETLIPNFIFVAPKDSSAIKYAQENGIEYIIEE